TEPRLLPRKRWHRPRRAVASTGRSAPSKPRRVHSDRRSGHRGRPLGLARGVVHLDRALGDEHGRDGVLSEAELSRVAVAQVPGELPELNSERLLLRDAEDHAVGRSVVLLDRLEAVDARGLDALSQISAVELTALEDVVHETDPARSGDAQRPN